MAVVTVLYRRPSSSGPAVELPATTRAFSWTGIVTNAVLVVTMIRAGDRLDASPVLSIITLGGHHQVVLGLAAAGLLLLAGLAPCTGGFARAGDLHQVLLPVAGVVSLVALAGVLAVGGLAIGLIAVLVLLCRPRPRIDVIQRRR